MNPPAALQQAFDAHNAGDYGRAEAGYLDVLRASPEVFDALHLLGLAYKKQGRLNDAAAFVRASLRLRPESAYALGNYASILYDKGNYKDAAVAGRLAIERDPQNFTAHANLGNALAAQQQFEDAITHYRVALKIEPGHPFATGNLASALTAVGDYDGAALAYKDALALTPTDPELNVGYSMLLLQIGDFAEGFSRYESRWGLQWLASMTRKSVVPEWRGESSLAGRSILLRAEQGLGDTLQFCRYIPLVAAVAHSVYVEVQAPLFDLLVHQFGDQATFIRQGDALPTVDCECPLLSLPLAFRTTLTTIPAGTSPYLEAPPSRITTWAARMPADGRPRVGFVWNANRVGISHAMISSERRSIALDSFASVMRSQGIQAVALQKEMSPAEETILAGMPGVLNVGQHLGDFADTAAVIKQLDLVITVDTSVAHVAGALGKPVWVLVPAAADWRWLRGRTDSPWYASARLFCQERPGTWDGVLSHVQLALSAWCA